MPIQRLRPSQPLAATQAASHRRIVKTDLDALPHAWLSPPSARRVLFRAGIPCDKIDALEVYSGSARWTRACEAAKLLTCLSHGVDIRSGDQWDLTTEGARRLLWAVIVVCVPKWVHSEFPCTIWASLAHTNRKSATIGDDEESRTCALVHVILTCQLARWQSKKGYHVSFENPPSARSWKLDIVQDTMAAIGANAYKTASCA